MAAEASPRWQQLQRSVVAQFVGEGPVIMPNRLAPLKAAVDATQEHLHKLKGELQQFVECEARLDRLDVKTRELQPVPETTTRNAKQRLQKQQVGLTADLLRSAGALEPSLLVDATSEIRNAFAADASAPKSVRSFDELMAAADALAAADRHAWLREWPDRIYYAWGRLCMRVVLLALFLCPCLLRVAQLPPRLLAAARWRLAADDVPTAAKQSGDGDPGAVARPVAWAPPSSEAGAGRGADRDGAAGGAKDKTAAPTVAGLRQRRPLPSNAGLSGSLGRRAAAEVSQAMAAAAGVVVSGPATSAPANEPAAAAGSSLMASLHGEGAGATAKVATALTALRDRFAVPTATAAADAAPASAAGGQGAVRGVGAAGGRGKGGTGGGATSSAAVGGASGATSTRGAPTAGGQAAAGKPP
jgi:hypothetical protein